MAAESDPVHFLRLAEERGLLDSISAEVLRAQLVRARRTGECVDLHAELAARGITRQELEELSVTAGDTAVIDTRALQKSFVEQLPVEPGWLGGRYQVHEALGEGGMGKVWRATDHQLKREVAIKGVRAGRGARTETFIDEAQITGQLQHPNIVPIHELCFDEVGEPYLVMKRVKGRSLKELLASERYREDELDGETAGADGRESLQRFLQIFLKVCDAVSYAHARGVLHRDLKPGNIMIGEFGEVLVMDWGLAKARPGEASEPDLAIEPERRGGDTRYGQVKGTLAYMPPEQAAGEIDKLDARSDVFSLGAILYQLLTLRAPFVASDPEELIAAVLEVRIAPPSERTPARHIPHELEAVVLKAMRKDPEARYPSVELLREDVETFLGGGLVAAYRYTPWQRVRRWLRRNRGFVGSLAALVVLLLGVWFALGWVEDAALERAQAENDAALAEQLDAKELRLRELDGDLRRLEEALAADPERVLVEADSFAVRHGKEIDRLARDALLEKHRRAALDVAATLPDSVASLRARAQEACARQALERLRALPPDERALAAEEGYARFLAVERRPESLPIADFAAERAAIALARGEVATASLWVARAFTAQPRVEAAGRGFLALARTSLQSGAIETAVLQFHSALSAFGERHSALRSEALLGLAQALTSHGAKFSRPSTPFAPGVRPRIMGLRCLLELATPDGELRPAVRASLPAAQRERFAEEVASQLFVLRRISAAALPEPRELVDLDGDGRCELSVRWDAPGRRMVVEQVGPPAAPGTGPWTSEAVAEVDLDHLLGAREVLRWQLLRLGPDELGFSLLLDDRRLWVFTDLDAGAPAIETTLTPDIRPLELHDLDGDGRRDLLAVGGYQTGSVLAWFREADGSFTAATELRRAWLDDPQEVQQELGRPASWVRSVVCEDLDGDGKPELALSLGIWNHFSVEVWDGPGRNLRLASWMRLGNSDITALREPGGRVRLATFTALDLEEERFFTLMGEETPRMGYRELGYDGRLEELPPLLEHPQAPYAHWNVEQRACAGREVFVYKTQSWSTVFVLEGSDVPVYVHTESLGIDPGSGLWHDMNWPLWGVAYRLLRDEDLETLLALPIPLDESLPEAADPHEICTFLTRFELHAAAVSTAREALARTDLDELMRLRLLRLEVHALAAQERWGEAWDAIRALEPANDLVVTLFGALDELTWRLSKRAPARELVGDWLQAEAIDPFLRGQLANVADKLEREARLFEKPAVDWRGKTVVSGADTLALAGLLVAAAPAIVDWEDLRFLSRPGPAGLLWVERPRAREVAVQPTRSQLLGVPVQFGGGPWRIVADLRVRAQPWSARARLGLFDPWQLEQGKPTLGAGLELHCRGGNEVNHLQLFGKPFPGPHPGHRLDEKIGRWLRVDVEHRPERRLVRVTVADRATGEVHASDTVTIDAAALRAGLYVLGIGDPDGGEGACELEVARLALCGDAVLAEPQDPALLRLFEHFPALALHSALARAELRDDPVAGRAALAALEDAADELRAGLDEGEAEVLGGVVQHARFTLASASHDAVPGLAAAFAQAIADDPAGADHLGAWLLSRPQLSARAAREWRAAGQALAGRLFPGLAGLDLRVAVDQRVVEAEAVSAAEAAVALSLEEGSDDPLGVFALYRLAVSRSGMADYQASQLAVIAALEARRGAEAPLPSDYQTLHGVQLLKVMRRAEGIALLPDGHPLKTLNLRLQAERARERQQTIEHAAAQRIAFPELR